MFTKSIKKGGTCELVRAVRSVMGWQYLHLREAPMVNVIPARKIMEECVQKPATCAGMGACDFRCSLNATGIVKFVDAFMGRGCAVSKPKKGR